jgi:hypothetical protein
MTLPVWTDREGRRGWYDPLAIVFGCALGVSDYAAAGKQVEVPEQRCPACRGRLRWWSGYWRGLRDAGARVRMWVRRGRCAACEVTHAVLPDFLVERRRYAVEVIGRALEVVATSSAWGASVELDRPFSTVRDWRNRCRQRAAEMQARLAQLALQVGVRLGELPVKPLLALLAVLEAVWRRSRELEPGVGGRWRFWNAVFSGKGLATNTSPGW